jgi:anti-anti-sigma factor
MTASGRCYHLTAERVADGFAAHPLGHLSRQAEWLGDERLLAVADQVAQGRLYLDWGRVEYLSGEGLAWLLRLRRRVDLRGGRLVLCNLRPLIKEVLEICRLQAFFDYHTGPLPGAGPRLIEPSWLAFSDGLIPRLARAIAQDGTFDHLPVLGDALEEAGCADADVLGHCRCGGRHARDCWVLAALLGPAC